MTHWTYQLHITFSLPFYRLLSTSLLFSYLASTVNLTGQVPTLINESPPCGFEQIYEGIAFPSSNLIATETDMGFSIAYSLNETTNDLAEKEILIDSNGNLLDSTITKTPVDTIIQGAIIDDNAFIAAQGITADTTIRLFKTDFQGQELWEQRFLFKPINQIFSLTSTEVFATADAYYILGNYVDVDTSSTRANYFFFAIKTDKTGKLLVQNTYLARDFIRPRIATIDGNDNVYITYQTSARIAYIAKLGADGMLLWDSRIIGDLVSNQVRTIELSNDGQAIIVAGYSDPKAFVRKYDVETGELLWDVRPGELFSTDGDFTVQERSIDIIETADDGIIVSYPYQSTNNFSDAGRGEEYGKLDTDGEPIWWQRLTDRSFGASRPVLETANGDILFLAKSDKGQLVAFKTSPTGSLLPDCNPSVPTCTAEIITFNSQAEVDAFGSCERFEGNIAIAGADITNLEALKGLKEITEGLFIRSTATSLLSLEGLNDLEKIGHILEIVGAQVADSIKIPLANLDALSNLTNLGRLFISNTNLQQVDGLSNLIEVSGYTSTIGTTERFISGSTQFVGNDLLESLQLTSLTNVNGDLTIGGNPKLVNLSGLQNLQSIGEQLVIGGNQILETLSGLENVSSVNAKGENPAGLGLAIENNPKLNDCCALFDLLDNSTIPNGFSIQGNAFECEDFPALVDVCNPLPSTICKLLKNLALDPCNPLVTEVAIYEYQGSNFLVTVPDMSMIADLPTVVRSCETGEQFCVFGFVADPEPCRIFFEDAIKVKTVLTKATDCTECICPEIEELVCGADGQVYNSPCEADCAGVTWTAGPCPDEAPFIDLELAINTPNPNPALYTRLPLSVTINNKGNIVAENVVVRLTMCSDQSSGFQRSSGLVYSTTNFTATQGDYDYLEQRWDLSELEAGGSATLMINLFNLTTDGLNIATYISEASPDDIDSTPGFIRNSGFCVTNEDDEVQLSLNAIRICDCPTEEFNPVCGSDGYTYDNACEADCAGVNYEIGACTKPSGTVTCKEITVNYEKGKIEIIGEQRADYFFKVHRRVPTWEYVFECNGKCGFGQTINDLAAGTYYIDVYDKSWHLICDDIEVTLGEGAFQSTINEQQSRIEKLSVNKNNTIEQGSLKGINIYPNPARDRLTIDLDHAAYQKGQLYFSDAFGRLVKEIALQQVGKSIPITDLKTGVYQLHLVVNRRIITTEKLVILR